MKYIVYRFPDAVKFDPEREAPYLSEGFSFPVKPELVAVEFGRDIFSVTDALIQAVKEDLSTTEAYARCSCTAYPPEDLYCVPCMSNEKFDYEISGVVYDYSKPENTVIYYGIQEKPEE